MRFLDKLSAIMNSNSTKSDTIHYNNNTNNKYNAVSLFDMVNKRCNNIPDTPTDIANKLVNAIFQINTGDLDTPMNSINSGNVIDVLNLYQEISNKKNSILGIQFDKETLFEAILDENIPNKDKKKYLQRLVEGLLYSIPLEDEDRDNFNKRFLSAIDNALNESWPNQSSKEIESIAKEIIDLHKSEYFNSAIKNIEKQTYNLDTEINKKDILGNGKLDNSAKQISTNCRAHSIINGILATDNGKNYLNSLIYKDEDTGNITISLPGAKEAGLPKPKGDGKYTYTENQILNNISKAGYGQIIGEGLGNIKSRATSIGDGDETALLMAMQDFLIEYKGQSLGESFPILSSFVDEDYTRSLFGKEIKANLILPVNDIEFLSDKDINILEQGIKGLKESLLQTTETKKDIIKYTTLLINYSSDNNKKIKYFKDIFESNKYFISVGILGDTDLSDVKQIGTNGFLTDQHAYAIKNIKNDTITLIESNNPNNPITIKIDDFFNKFITEIFEYPEDI